MRQTLAIALLGGTLVAGCTNRPFEAQALYALDGGAHAAGAAPGAPGATHPVHPCVLRVQGVTVAPPYGTTQFVYRYADGRMRSDPYAGFIASPGSLVRGAVLERLQDAGLFEEVLGSSLASVPAYELQVSLRTLGAWFDGAGGTARIEGTAFVARVGASGTAIVATVPLAGSAPLAADDAAAVAGALNAALAQCLEQLVDGLRAASLPALGDDGKAVGP
jgi:ABC-type uncharacterized transport system auxiliary subunit